MSIPCILVIDDQYASDPDERALLLTNTNTVEITTSTSEAELARHAKDGKTAGVVFCRGQEVRGKTVCNDYGVIRQAVADGWGADRPWRWALVLLDVMFVSGSTNNGLPSGQEGDDHFGEDSRAQLVQNQEFADLPLVMLTSKEQKELKKKQVPFLSKKGLNADTLKSKLLENGNLTDEQTARILQLERGIVVRSPAMRKVFWLALSSAPTDSSVLLLGETGVGKEVVAQFVHEMSRRSARPFIAKNIASIPETLMDSELFGIERRIATGVDRRDGLFMKADTGTLFLDEIGNMAEEVQARVLRALEDHMIEPVGATQPVHVDIRLISATSKDLDRLIQENSFRKDLYYRINTITIKIPPLRERREEIGLLAETFLQDQMRTLGKSGLVLSEEAKSLLETYEFPGNVRQLRNLIEGIVILKGNNEVIFPEDIAPSLNQPAPVGRLQEGVGEIKSERDQLQLQLRDAQQRVNELEQQVADITGGPQAPVLTLASIVEHLAQISISPQAPAVSEHDPLWGVKPKLEEAVCELLKRIAGAALEGTKKFPGDSPERTDAVRRIEGDASIKRTKIPRTLKAILGHTQSDNRITEEDINELIEAWRSGPH